MFESSVAPNEQSCRPHRLFLVVFLKGVWTILLRIDQEHRYLQSIAIYDGLYSFRVNGKITKIAVLAMSWHGRQAWGLSQGLYGPVHLGFVHSKMSDNHLTLTFTKNMALLENPGTLWDLGMARGLTNTG